jgi:flavodoxin
MRSLVVYESMYGNTHLIAEAIGRGLAGAGPVDVVPVGQASPELLEPADLVVVGGPTHAHGMTRESTRKGAAEALDKPDNTLTLDPDAAGEGLREWFDGLADVRAAAAAFDTRFEMAAALTGRASRGINKRLKKHGFDVVADPESFFVERDSSALEAGEESRAEAWGESLAHHVVTAST